MKKTSSRLPLWFRQRGAEHKLGVGGEGERETQVQNIRPKSVVTQRFEKAATDHYYQQARKTKFL